MADHCKLSVQLQPVSNLHLLPPPTDSCRQLKPPCCCPNHHLRSLTATYSHHLHLQHKTNGLQRKSLSEYRSLLLLQILPTQTFTYKHSQQPAASATAHSDRQLLLLHFNIQVTLEKIISHNQSDVLMCVLFYALQNKSL